MCAKSCIRLWAMIKKLLSVGLDIGTTSTQMIVSELTVENQASAFSVPEMQISQRQILYRSPIHFTPLVQDALVDGDKLRILVAEEYRKAGICRDQVDTGAVIITGETSRKENAATVVQSLSQFAGDFVVATAGPDLESILAATGAGAVAYSEQTGKPVLHMDIGGGTSNLALIDQGQILATACLNVGGRLVKFREDGSIRYLSPVLKSLFPVPLGQVPTSAQLDTLAETLTAALEMSAGLTPKTSLLDQLATQEVAAETFSHFLKQIALVQAQRPLTISFSGGVADCIGQALPDFAFGDIGPILGRAIRRSRLCAGQYRLGTETIRAKVIGAGSYATQLSGSTVFHQNVTFPLKNLPVVTQISQLSQLDTPGVLYLTQAPDTYPQIIALADRIVANWPTQPVLLCAEADMAKALGHALALRFPKHFPILCIDRVRLQSNSYLDVGAPVASALPVVVKTLILNK